MTRPTFGTLPRGRIRAAVADPRLAIVAQCHEPTATRTARAAGEPTPCYRCLALDTFERCHFTTGRMIRS